MRFFSPHAGLTGSGAKTIEGEARASSFFISHQLQGNEVLPMTSMKKFFDAAVIFFLSATTLISD